MKFVYSFGRFHDSYFGCRAIQFHGCNLSLLHMGLSDRAKEMAKPFSELKTWNESEQSYRRRVMLCTQFISPATDTLAPQTLFVSLLKLSWFCLSQTTKLLCHW